MYEQELSMGCAEVDRPTASESEVSQAPSNFGAGQRRLTCPLDVVSRTTYGKDTSDKW